MVKSRKMELIKIFLFFFWIILLIGCTDNSIEPTDQVEGVSGRVYDMDGQSVSGAKIYCLFYLHNVATDPNSKETLPKLSGIDDFNFDLFQNFPNPFAHSFFLRFSLPEECTTTLTILSKKTGNVIYQRTEDFPYGLFQLYFDKIVDNLQLRNGIYQYHIKALGKSSKIYEAAKSLLVVSNAGPPNTISDLSGHYIFDLHDAFIGDSVTETYGQEYTYYRVLNRFVNLIIMKDGYKNKLISVELLPGALLAQDIILYKDP